MEPSQMIEKVLSSMKERTGRTPEEWAELVRAASLPDAKARRRWLKEEHGLKQNSQWAIAWLVDQQDGKVDPTDDELLQAQYAGAKAHLRPIYDAVLAAAEGLGDDSSMSMRKTYVTLRRGKGQYALLQPTTRTRCDLGLRLKVAPDDLGDGGGRLQEAGSFGSGTTTHKVALTSPEDVDDAVISWLREAYDQRG